MPTCYAEVLEPEVDYDSEAEREFTNESDHSFDAYQAEDEYEDEGYDPYEDFND